ncbi:AI-2E family transporter [Rhizosaccharibacter radicis]|uniref:AI-2E family transporter n=1 Tax=Rhizosaccharibacter radicis TaxID=2782605 RepID=A0ABT1VT28_9PROT|nr:AI-2E family transporter [Acetobacteraceae bacterium KSS12]
MPVAPAVPFSMPLNALPASPLPRARVPAADAPRAEKLTGIVVAVVAVAALYFGREVLIPITLSVLLSFVLAPLVALLRRLKLPRVPAVLLSVVAALGVLLMLGGVIGTQIASLSQDLPRYQSTIEHKVASVRGFAAAELRQLTARFSRETGDDSAETGVAPARVGGEKPMPVVVQQPTPTPVHLLQQVLGPILGPIETVGIVFVVAIFILLQREDLRDRLIRLFGSNDLLRTTAALDDAGSRLARYFLTQLGINTSFGVLVGIGLAVIGVPNPVLWGVLGGLLRFVPYIGSSIAAILPVALAAAVDPGWSMVIWTAALFLVTEGIMGQAVEPLVYGHSTGLSPVAVIVVAIFWSWIWGPIGLILSTPLTLCLVVVGRHVDRLEFLDVLLGDRPALTPVESFYQRLLAGDEDEMLRQAEALLRQRSLSSYYDDVVLKGLQLAAADMQRGGLHPERIEIINRTIGELVHELDGHDDADPASGPAEQPLAGRQREERAVPATPAPLADAPARDALPARWRGDSPVLCLAGRGPLDISAASILTQLLEKHGLGARVVTHHAVSREAMEALDPSGVAMVCVSYLDMSGNPTRLRSLLRRLRQKLPDVPVVVGLWPAAEVEGLAASPEVTALHNDAALRAELGADHYVSTLAEAVTACVSRAQEEASRLAA